MKMLMVKKSMAKLEFISDRVIVYHSKTDKNDQVKPE